jgi:hypothetical protein
VLYVSQGLNAGVAPAAASRTQGRVAEGRGDCSGHVRAGCSSLSHGGHEREEAAAMIEPHFAMPQVTTTVLRAGTEIARWEVNISLMQGTLA